MTVGQERRYIKLNGPKEPITTSPRSTLSRSEPCQCPIVPRSGEPTWSSSSAGTAQGRHAPWPMPPPMPHPMPMQAASAGVHCDPGRRISLLLSVGARPSGCEWAATGAWVPLAHLPSRVQCANSWAVPFQSGGIAARQIVLWTSWESGSSAGQSTPLGSSRGAYPGLPKTAKRARDAAGYLSHNSGAGYDGNLRRSRRRVQQVNVIHMSRARLCKADSIVSDRQRMHTSWSSGACQDLGQS